MMMYFKFANGEERAFKNVERYIKFDDEVIVFQNVEDYKLTHNITKKHILMFSIKEDENESKN